MPNNSQSDNLFCHFPRYLSRDVDGDLLNALASVLTGH
jgi:hypothetical protein